MPHVSDFTQAPKKIVLDLVNEANSTAFTEALVEVSLHAQQTVTERNSRILLTALPGSGYSGEQALEYDRLQISGFTDLYYPGGMVIPLGDATSLVECIPEIEAGLGIKLTLDLDYEDQEITPWSGIPNETKLIQVPILPTSLIYLGELEFILDGNDIPLDSVITLNILSGLNLPVTEEDNSGWTSLTLHESAQASSGQVYPAGTWRVDGGSWNDGVQGFEVPAGSSSLDFNFDVANPSPALDSLEVTGIERFQTLGDPDLSFEKTEYFTSVPEYLPPNVKRLTKLCCGATTFNDPKIANWDTEHVEKMDSMFEEAALFNQDLSSLDTSNVTEAIAFSTLADAWEAGKPTFSAGTVIATMDFTSGVYDDGEMIANYGVSGGASAIGTYHGGVGIVPQVGGVGHVGISFIKTFAFGNPQSFALQCRARSISVDIVEARIYQNGNLVQTLSINQITRSPHAGETQLDHFVFNVVPFTPTNGVRYTVEFIA